MRIDVTRIRQFLRNTEIETLLIEELGWDRHRETLDVEIDERTYSLTAVAQKRGMVVFICSTRVDGSIPDYATRRKIEQQVAKSVHEHLIIYTDNEKTTQIWQWVKREAGRPSACREHHYHKGQSGDALIQKLETIAFSLEEEADLTLVDVTGRVRAGFDVERVTKRFYDRFKKEHGAFLKFLKGIPDEEMQRGYASVMLNRLMFIYFIQKKGFLNNDTDYLHTKLAQSQEHGRDRYYKAFLCPLFFEGFAKLETERTREMNRLLGRVPYLNGGIFQRHQIEQLHGKTIQIDDAAFEQLFHFFDQYQWHLDERPLRSDNEINPDVLGYIFEKYINQKQMGAYYTKEDITEYISKNTVIPFLFDVARKGCKIAFEGESGVWKLLQADPERYIYDAVKKGVELNLPPEIAIGIDDISKRTEWNTLAPPEYALSTEIWREVVARRQRDEAVRGKLSNGEIHDINELITHNLDIRQFAQDVIEDCEGPERLRAFWKAITRVTVLDPTCGSGAFLFAALNILESLYEACLDRMEAFIAESDEAGTRRYSDFRRILERIDPHPNRRYFVLKSIIVNNLYGVDIMDEAVEICRLRMFLKLVAQIADVAQVEPLPDIDFNIQAGNTLVGFATYDEAKRVISEGRLDFDNTMGRIEQKAEDVDRLFALFRQQQTELGGVVTPEDKAALQKELSALDDELNRYLAGEYGVDPKKEKAYRAWLKSHKPFHWFIEFYGILKGGGFDVIIGNPPYVMYNKIKKQYTIVGHDEMETLGNLYAFTMVRSMQILDDFGRCGMILPIASVSVESMKPLQKKYESYLQWHSHFATRPGKLFVGVDMNLTITLLSTSKQTSDPLFSTTYYRWSNGVESDRDVLFQKLQYADLPTDNSKHITKHPKFGDPIEMRILQRMLNHGRRIENYAMRGSQPLYYHSGGRYWRKALPTKFSSHYKPLLVSPEIYGICFCLLNSQLFYWYWITHSNCMDVVNREVLKLPVFDLQKADSPLSDALMEQLLLSYSEGTTTRKRRGEMIHVDEINFDVQKSKPIIDEIDRALAKHYDFTDEELDFIINYDIKYRMGLGSNSAN